MGGAEFTIAEAQAVLKARVIPGAAKSFCGVSIDSRQIAPGQAFFAIVGERFDGHQFLEQAVERGARVAVVSRQLEAPAGVTLLRVQDTRIALGELARAWKRKVDPPTVAITGSVGKTTTKELTATLLGQLGRTHSTEGNLNNDYGLPLTILAMPASTDYLVLEMGMNAPGEIDYLTRIAEPSVGLVTAVAPVHLEGLGSLEAVAEAKGELLRGLDERGIAVVPSDQPLLLPSLEGIDDARVLRFGPCPDDAAQIVSVESLGVEGLQVQLCLRGQQAAFKLPLVGPHNARNAAAAAAALLALGVSPGRVAEATRGIGALRLKHRSSLLQLGGWTLLDDCYNANPVAVEAALETLVQLAAGAPTVAVLGEMLELGEGAAALHREVGQTVAALGVGRLITVGELGGELAQGALVAGMLAEKVVMVGSAEEAAQEVLKLKGEGWLLVKGSRGARLERVIEELKQKSSTD